MYDLKYLSWTTDIDIDVCTPEYYIPSMLQRRGILWLCDCGVWYNSSRNHETLWGIKVVGLEEYHSESALSNIYLNTPLPKFNLWIGRLYIAKGGISFRGLLSLINSNKLNNTKHVV